MHVICGDGEAKYWLSPGIELARNHRLSSKRLKDIERIIERHKDVITSAWNAHFAG